MRHRIRLAALGILLLGAGAFAISLIQSAQNNAGTQNAANIPVSSVLSTGARVPTDFTLQRLGGSGTIQLSRLVGGHDAVINLFASWCQACAAELGAFATVSKSAHKGVVFVGIDTNDPDSAKALVLLRDAGVTFPVGVDTADLGVASAYGVANLPTTLYLAKNGRLVRAVLGAQTAAQMRQTITSLH